MNDRSGLIQEAARIYCEEQLTDYHAAKQRAAQRLGLGARGALPENAEVQRAVIEYQELFGGSRYREHLRAMRRTAVSAMKLLAPFEPVLVGAAVSGAATAAHRVQLHAVSDKPEMLEIFLQDANVRCEQGERSYSWSRGGFRGRELKIPLVRFDAGGMGVDVAVFTPDEMRATPIDPATGEPYRRLDLAAARALAT